MAIWPFDGGFKYDQAGWIKNDYTYKNKEETRTGPSTDIYIYIYLFLSLSHPQYRTFPYLFCLSPWTLFWQARYGLQTEALSRTAECSGSEPLQWCCQQSIGGFWGAVRANIPHVFCKLPIKKNIYIYYMRVLYMLVKVPVLFLVSYHRRGILWSRAVNHI